MLLESNANFPCSNLLSNNYFFKVSQKISAKSEPGDAYSRDASKKTRVYALLGYFLSDDVIDSLTWLEKKSLIGFRCYFGIFVCYFEIFQKHNIVIIYNIIYIQINNLQTFRKIAKSLFFKCKYLVDKPPYPSDLCEN